MGLEPNARNLRVAAGLSCLGCNAAKLPLERAIVEVVRLAGSFVACLWRQERETGFREFKTYLRGAGRILRGSTPDLARQELWAYLVIYQAIRAVIFLAAASARLDPDRISFTTALHAVRRTLAAARTSPDAALADTQADILSETVPQRHGRICLRAVTQPSSPYPSRGNKKGPASQHADYSVTIRHPDRDTHTSTDQAKQPGSTQSQPL